MKKQPRAIVLAGNGTNCETESAHACRLGGFEQVDIISIWELLCSETMLQEYDFLVFPGGFLDGDDLGAAKAQANRILHSKIGSKGTSLFSQLVKFILDGKLILGICNGFQLMVKLGLLPGFDGNYSLQRVTLTFNDSGRFEDRWVWLKVNEKSPCIYTRGIDMIYLPVRHGEGKFVASDQVVLNTIIAKELHTVVYADPITGEPACRYPDNPNGSQYAIAGICDPSGRLFGLMPHPEAYIHRTNHPRWTRENLEEEGMGVALFRNAYNYLKDCCM